MQKILITGAGGFVGSHLVERALAEGMEVWAAVRATSSRAYLTDPRLHFIVLDFDGEADLPAALTAHLAETGRAFDHVIHAAGVTKCRQTADFFRVNTQGTARFAAALLRTKALKGRFVFVSSLSVMGESHDVPRPNTAYGKSKLEAEAALEALIREGLDVVILRPTGIYGPRERDYLMMAQSIAKGIDFAVGFAPQHITFIYVSDLVAACFLALTRGTTGGRYALSDGNTYNSRAFSDLIREALGKRFVLHITAPIWLLRMVCTISEWWAGLRGASTTLNRDKFHILAQRDWRCDISPAQTELGYQPQVDLASGVRKWLSGPL